MRRNTKWMTDTAKLNATELAKLEKDGLDVVGDVDRFAQQGLQGLSAADYDRLKWLGVYVQRPKEAGRFLLRVKIPGGLLTAEQAEAIAAISRTYAQATINITTRQCVEFHWLTLQVLPAVLKSLAQAGLTTLEAAGDCPRNIIGEPLAGIDPDEFIDTTQILQDLHVFFQNNRDFSNLPRKFKIAVSGSMHNAINAEINDVAFVPAIKEVNGELIKGFEVLVGGGLSHQPRLAVRLPFFVQPHEVVKVAGAVATIFRDYGYREKRNHARLKYLVADWGKEKFAHELQKITGPLTSGGAALSSKWNAGLSYGLHPQKQPGLYYWGLSIPGGKISPEELLDAARIARQYGDATLRTTTRQDLVVANIAEQHREAVMREALFVKQAQIGQSAAAHMVACPGKEFCQFALAETKGRIAEIAAALDETFGPGLPVRIHLSGCGNACGQTQIADIGLQGAVTVERGAAREAFEIWVGGHLGNQAKLAVKIPGKTDAAQVKETIIELINDYRNNRCAGETFSEYVERKGILAYAGAVSA